MRTILLTGAFPYTPEQIKQIESFGIKTIFMQNEAEELPDGASDVEMVVCNGLFLSHSIDCFANLKCIQLTSAGLDRVPLDEIKKKGIRLYNARGVYSIPMAEWAVLRTLEFYKAAGEFAEKQKVHNWEKRRDLQEINGKAAGVIGAGNVGNEVAKRFQAFGATCIGYDVFLSESPYFEKIVKIEQFAEQVENLDIVVLTAPHTPETHHMINGSILKRLKPGAVLINIARGGLIDEQELIQTLRERKDIYVSLDVFEVEPIVSESPLWDFENVSVSPHNSFVSTQNNVRLFNLIFNNIKDYLSIQ